MYRIRIKKLEVFANHGVHEEENVLGQKFVFSLTLHMLTSAAGRSDEIEDSVNYSHVCKFVKKLAEDNTYNLLECLAERTAAAILDEFSLVSRVDLEVEKPWAPIGLPLESVSVEVSRSWHRAFIGLGSNIGDRRNHLDRAVSALDALDGCQVVRVSDYIETEPYGGVEQDDFLNGALELRTRLEADALLDMMQEIELGEGRERTVRWGPRTLDLDLLFFDDAIIDTPNLTVPHSEIQKRDFVLAPLEQIAPGMIHPQLAESVQTLREKLKNEQNVH